MKKKRVIIDCDPGVDDFLAIGLAILSGEIEINSLTTVVGNVAQDKVAINASNALNFFNQGHLRVYKGATKPWVVDNVNSQYVFGHDGLGGQSSSLKISDIDTTIKAEDHILSEIKEQNLDALICLGPLTNIANAFKKDMDRMNSLNEVIVMGGAVNSKGNITEYAEFNFYNDPHAADFVLSHADNLTLIPLDVTEKVILQKNDLELIDDPKSRDFLRSLTASSFEFASSRGYDGIFLHDPLAVGYAIDNSCFTTVNIPISVETSIEKRGLCKKSENHHDVTYAKNVISERFMSYFISTFKKM